MSEFGHVKIDRDAALDELYQRLKKRNAGCFSSLNEVGRRAYYRDKKRASRSRDRQASADGSPAPTTANIREALADAALMLIATAGPGADQVLNVLTSVFAERPGVPLSIEQRAKSGRLRPKMVAL